MKNLLFILISVTCLQSYAQEHAWVFLKNKPNEAAYIATPLMMLSQRALDRRTTQKIALDIKDVPVEVSYYNALKNAAGITVLAKSKWLNAIHVLGEETAVNNLRTTFSFIESIEFANDALNSILILKPVSKRSVPHQNKFKKKLADFNYGNATNQIEMLGGHILHQNGFTGAGMHIAVIDAGFPNVNTLDAFSRIRANNQILGGYDFVAKSDNFYSGHNHGTNVLSDIAGYIEGVFVGTAPDASFYLFRTEDDVNETPLEESLWVAAAERADSLGVDIINTSLGYTTFDNPNYDYSYADLDGKTAFISRGAEIGASRGMLLVNAAGNSGNNAWKYIGVPADAASVFSIGAVNAAETIAVFSSFGPTPDGRIKPDVLAHGQSVYVINHTSGAAVTSNGTSFSSPVIAGVIACFWQAFPNKTNLEIMQIIRESADRYTNPTDQYGYGVPDFAAAYGTTLSVKDVLLNTINVYPNPVENILTLANFQGDLGAYKAIVYNVLGEQVFKQNEITSSQLDLSELKKGVYFLTISNENKQEVFKLFKK